MPEPEPQPVPRDDAMFGFDAARALAALAVLAAHARSFTVLDRAGQPAASLPAETFMALTALGHQAVVVFLVVSGALVTRSMRALLERGAWSPARFAAARLTRLWVVLIPCLILGGLQDRLGLAIDPLGSAATFTIARLDGWTFLGNVAFLQGLVVPTFGTNAPLWTLAVEAWCYLFACAAVSMWLDRRTPLRSGLWAAALGAAAFWVLTPTFWVVLSLWFVGALLGLGLERGRHAVRATVSPPVRWMAAAALAVVVLRARWDGDHPYLADYAVAGSTAVVLLVWAEWRPASGPLVRAIRRIAAMSYTLYVSHFPLLALLALVVGGRSSVNARSLAEWGGACALALVQALLLWALFERRTTQIREAVAACADRLGRKFAVGRAGLVR